MIDVVSTRVRDKLELIVDIREKDLTLLRVHFPEEDWPKGNGGETRLEIFHSSLSFLLLFGFHHHCHSKTSQSVGDAFFLLLTHSMTRERQDTEKTSG